MLENITTLLILAIISLFPIVIWAYVFSYIDDSPLNKKRFSLGVVGGILSVFPILYLDKIIAILDFDYLNIFYYVSQIKGILSSMEFGISLFVFLLIIILFSFLFGGFIHKFKSISKIYFKNILVFLIFVLLLSFFTFLFDLFIGKVDFVVTGSVTFGDIIFNSFKLIIFYYLVVAFIEESSKHFNFLQTSVLQIKTINQGVLYAIFVALGFSLIENILYLYNIYLATGFSGELVQVYFFRSLFSVIVHVLASSVVGYYFSKALLLYRNKDLSLSYMKIFGFGLLMSILLHLFFDVALTLGFSFIMFIYFIGGYLYVSSLFYKD